MNWKRNFFKIPTCADGESLVAEIARLINLWVNKTALESAAFAAMHVFASIMLQKPAKKSKNKDHIRYLGERVKKWKDGCFDELLSECEMIQKKMSRSSTRQNHDQITRVFTRLMLQGKVSSALRWVTDNTSKPLDITPQVKTQLEEKHPDAAPLATGALINGTPPTVEPVLFENIDADLIFTSAKLTTGSSGPSGLDSDTWRRI